MRENAQELDDPEVSWWRRRPELETRTLNDLIRFLMAMDAKLDEILAELRDDDDQEA